MNSDIALLIVGGLIAFFSSTLSAVVLFALEGRRLRRQWEREDQLRLAEWQREDDLRVEQERREEISQARKFHVQLHDGQGIRIGDDAMVRGVRASSEPDEAENTKKGDLASEAEERQTSKKSE